MNIYGDRGNVLAVLKRCEWRGIDTEISKISIGQPLHNIYDLYFFGGGQDKEQRAVGEDLVSKKATTLHEAVSEGAALLAICGGYQLLGKFYKPRGEEAIPGAGIFNAQTIAGNRRMVGNCVVRLAEEFKREVQANYNYKKRRDISIIVGFENHSGKTYNNGESLGNALTGFGNNGEDASAGCIVQNAIGCYLHGSLLPKNPHIADFLIAKALKHHYKEPIDLDPLNDSIEWHAHDAAVKRAYLVQ